MTPEQKTQTLAKIVAAAVSQLGQRECPVGSNWGGRVIEYLKSAGYTDPEPWCLSFGLWCVQQAVPLAQAGLPRTGYCPAMADWGRQTGRLVSAADVRAGNVALRPGWLVLVWETDPRGYHHAGVVRSVDLDAGTFQSVEGNTAEDGGREGYMVAQHTRRLADVAADNHAKYSFLITL